MSETAVCWRQLGSMFLALGLSLGLVTGSADAQNFDEYRPNADFEEWVHDANPACMPEPFKISTDPYAYRLLAGAYGECAPSHYNPDTGSFDKPNMTDEEAAKWAGLAIGSLANPAVATYAGKEVLTAGAKCVLRSFIDASDEASPQTKETLKAAVDGAGTLFDWYGFATDIPELANPNRIKSVEAAVSVYISSIDRLPEGDSALEFLNNAWNSGVQGVREVYDGPRITAWKAAQYHTEQCEYDKAREQIELARKETDAACTAYGDGYRQAQKNMTIFMASNRRQVNLPFGSGDQAKGNYNLYLDAIMDRKEKLTELIKFYDELDRFEKGKEGPDMKARELREMQSFYKIYASGARDGIGTRTGCINAAKAIALVSPKNLTPQCRITFFQTKNDGTPRPEFLISDMAEYSYQQREERWAALDEVRTAHQQCELTTRDRKAADLRNLIATKPMFRILDGSCHQLTQPEILAALDKLSGKTPDYCKEIPVPGALIGMPLGEAVKALEAVNLYVGGVETVDPQEGQTPDVVIETDPASGTPVRIHSLVALTVTGKATEDPVDEVEMVEVPPLVPPTEGGAKAALASVGLKGVTGWEVPADKIELVPGYLVLASPAAGEMVELGSTVTLTIIGPRPKIEIPSIAMAKTLEEAKAILEAAGFVPGDEFEGQQAPPVGAPTAVFYATHPPVASTQEMFTTVSMIKYGLNRVPDAVIGQSSEDAAGILTDSGKFTVGSVSRGEPVNEGEKPGMVQATIPAVGTPLAKGAVVNLIVGIAREEEPTASEEDESDDNTDTPPEPDAVWPPAELLGNPNVIYGPASCFKREGESGPFRVWHGPNGEIACILVDGTPSADEPDASEQEDEPDDGGWIGRWVVSDFETGKLLLVLNITADPEGFLMKVFTNKDGELKKFAELLMVSDQAGVLRVHPKVLRSLDAKRDNNSSGNGVVGEIMEEGVGKVVEGLAIYLRTLRISRSGTTCTVSADIPEKGRQSKDVSCVKD